MVVGARSAVFAPTPHLGLIVIDEEHETTFKQDTAPRYHARDVAWQRAQAEGVPLVLGSATPSLESWQRTRDRRVPTRCRCPSACSNLPLPEVMTVDLRDPGQTRFSRGAISRPLHQAMTAALRDGGQVMLLLNRRGFATHIQCPACGFVLKCEHCDLALTYHRQHNTALCHYCDYEAPPPASVPRLQVARHPLRRPGHAEAGDGSAHAVPRVHVRADGRRLDAQARQPRQRARARSSAARSASCWARR